jgi:signal transduction histidine kinase
MIAGAMHWMPDWLVGPFIVVAPLSYLYAMIRYNLFGIDRLLNRTLVYATLSIGILLLYAGPLLLIYRFLPGDLALQLIIITTLTLVVGLSFNWTRARVQHWIDRLFYGGWYDYPGVVETISDALARCTDREQLTAVLTQHVPTLMQLQRGALSIDADPPDKMTLHFRLCFQSEVRAWWGIGLRLDGEDFTTADRRILTTLAHQAEMALGNVLLVETLRQQLAELHASRETLAQAQRRLLYSREEERARLARELHDGPLQVLVGLNLQTGLLLSQQATTAPITAALHDIRSEVQSLLTDLRQVCTDLRPPLLDTLGLSAALSALAEDWSAQHGLTVQVDVPGDESLRSLPAEVAVNVYRVVQEALSNIARHAAAQHVTLSARDDQPGLALVVHDDGCGFAPPTSTRDLIAQGHYGLVGMRERVDLIAGELQIDSAPGRGTTLRLTWRCAPTDRVS